MTHDYMRNGTAMLFAALDALEGRVISMCDESAPGRMRLLRAGTSGDL
jgi:hypothetical protein